MRHFIYILSDSTTDYLHCGMCNDVGKMIDLYAAMPTLILDGRTLNNLVYLEEETSPNEALTRYNKIIAMNQKTKKELIESINPEWMLLVPGVNIDLK